MYTEYVFKAYFQDDIRRFIFVDGCSIDKLRIRLAEAYEIYDFVIKHKDEDGDLVKIATGTALTSAVRVTPEKVVPGPVCGWSTLRFEISIPASEASRPE